MIDKGTSRHTSQQRMILICSRLRVQPDFRGGSGDRGGHEDGLRSMLRLLSKSPIGTALRNQWKSRVRYRTDGDLAIDINIPGRTVKPAAIGGRYWLFVATGTSGRRAAVLLRLVAS